MCLTWAPNNRVFGRQKLCASKKHTFNHTIVKFILKCYRCFSKVGVIRAKKNTNPTNFRTNENYCLSKLYFPDVNEPRVGEANFSVTDWNWSKKPKPNKTTRNASSAALKNYGMLLHLSSTKWVTQPRKERARRIRVVTMPSNGKNFSRYCAVPKNQSVVSSRKFGNLKIYHFFNPISITLALRA